MNTHFVRSLIAIAALASTSAWGADFQGTPSAPSANYAIKEQGVRAMRESPTRPTLDTSTKREASAPSVSERHTKAGHVTLLK